MKQQPPSPSYGRSGKMVIEDVVENEDGSATLKVELTSSEVRALLSYAICRLLEEEVDRVMEKEGWKDDDSEGGE